jgi:hypothetical protein
MNFQIESSLSLGTTDERLLARDLHQREQGAAERVRLALR